MKIRSEIEEARNELKEGKGTDHKKFMTELRCIVNSKKSRP